MHYTIEECNIVIIATIAQINPFSVDHKYLFTIIQNLSSGFFLMLYVQLHLEKTAEKDASQYKNSALC